MNPPTQYENFTIGCDALDMGQDFKLLIKKNRDLLSFNGINLNKVRFVFTPTFQYDLDADIINPNYVLLVPVGKNGLFKKTPPIIEINKPQNIATVTVNNYKFEDNYAFIKELTKKSKRGVVIYIIEHQDAVDMMGNKFSYEFGVDSEMIRLRDLDEIGVEAIEDCEQIL